MSGSTFGHPLPPKPRRVVRNDSDACDRKARRQHNALQHVRSCVGLNRDAVCVGLGEKGMSSMAKWVTAEMRILLMTKSAVAPHVPLRIATAASVRVCERSPALVAFLTNGVRVECRIHRTARRSTLEITANEDRRASRRPRVCDETSRARPEFGFVPASIGRSAKQSIRGKGCGKHRRNMPRMPDM